MRFLALAFVLLWHGQAGAQTTDELQSRLLGPAPVEAASPVQALPPPPTMPWWPLPVVAVTLVGLYAIRQRTFKAVAGSEPQVTVISQVAIAGGSGVAMLEAVDLDGRTRRLLIGTGSGPPRLIAELGGQQQAFVAAYDQAEAVEEAEAERLIDAVLAGTGGPS